MGDGLDAAEIVFQGNMLIGSVRVFVRQSETEQNAGRCEGLMHLRDKRNRAALTNEDSFFAEALFQCGLSFFENGISIRGDPGLSRAQDLELAMDGLWQKLSNVLFDEFGNLVRILIGHQAGGEFGESLCGNDGLGAFALVAAPEAVQFERRAGPKTFDGRETGFAEIAGRTDGL